MSYYRKNEGEARVISGRFVPAGAWVRVDLLVGIDQLDLRSFGRPMKGHRAGLGQLDGQEIVADSPVETIEAVEPPQHDYRLIIVNDEQHSLNRISDLNGSVVAPPDAGAAIGEALADGPVIVLHSSCVTTAAAMHAMWQAVLEAEADVVIALSNAQGPYAIPLAGAPGPWTSRMPAGDARMIADRLAQCRPTYPVINSLESACYALTPAALAAWGEVPASLSEAFARRPIRAVLADNAYVWSPARIDATTPAHWARRARDLGAFVASSPVETLPVQLLAVDLGTWGGSYCTLRLAEELARWGLRAQVGRLRDVSAVDSFPIGTVLHPREVDLPVRFPADSGWQDGILVATHWSTGRLVKRISARNPGVLPVAFWQDLEHRFVDEHGVAKFPADQARDYVAIPNRVVNAPWQIAESEGEFGIDWSGDSCEFIPVGIDCRLFRPRTAQDGRKRVLAMYRPQTPRRGAQRLLRAFEAIRAACPDVSLEVYGWSDGLPRWVVSHGFLTQPEVAELVREVDVFIEPSTTQGFGLPGAEAMASGVALVSTDNGGVHAYANQGSARIVPVDAGAIADAVIDLLRDDATRAHLAVAGRAAIEAIDWLRIGARWVIYLEGVWRAAGRTNYLPHLTQAAAKAAHVLGGETS